MSAQSQEIATRDPVRELVANIRSPTFKEQVKLALPDTTSGPDRFIRATVTALMQNPELAQADRNSLLQSVVKCAQDGLLPDGREAALVLFKGTVQYLPMIGGFRKIAAEFGWALRARVVYENDEFDYTEEPPTLAHRPVRPGAERGPLIAAYAVATHQRSGQRLQRVLHPEDVAKRRGMAQTDRVWKQWEPQMWEKSAGRDLFAELPLDEKDRERATRLIEAADVTPTEAVRMLYGPHAGERVNPVTGELTEATPREAAADGDDGGTPEDVGQQAEGSAAPSPTSEGTRRAPTEDPADPSAPGPTEDPGAIDMTQEPDADPPPQGFASPEESASDPIVIAANEAAEIEITFGKNRGKGLKLREVAAKSDGDAWLLWILRSWKTQPFKQQAWEYARVYAPDLYQKVLVEKEAA